MPIAGANIKLNSAEGQDKITITEKVTSAYFSDGSTELLAANIISESISDTNETYYFGISNSASATTTEFHITYGHVNGNGGNDYSNTVESPTKAIYKQFASMLLPAHEVTGGFFISRNNSLSTVPTNAAIGSGKDDEIFVLIADRSNMKDRLNKKNWTIILSGSSTGQSASAADLLHLTDDSTNDTPVATPAGDRFNIISGSDGTFYTASGASYKTYGFFYPDQGVMVFSGAELSASIPGASGSLDDVVVFGTGSQKGFGCTSNQDNNYKSALRFVNCLIPAGMGASPSKLKFRDEEDQTSAQYFCRAKAGQFNFSNNPTFVSGSQNELRHTTMKGNPTTYITSVQLFNSSRDMIAIGNLSKPLKKNFSSEATIKVKLTY